VIVVKAKKQTIVVVSGGFDPLHSGHLNLLRQAKTLGEKLIVILNNDEWLTRKKGRPFMPFEERADIIQHIDIVDNVFAGGDEDGSVCQTLEHIKKAYTGYNMVFANGGDRGKDNIPEMTVEGYEFVFGIGGTNKANSSSWILKEWKYPTERRVWGEFSNLFQDSAVKVKELIIEPGKGISYQRHFKRDEIWFVSHGQCEVKHGRLEHNPEVHEFYTISTDQVFIVRKGEWHQIVNKGKVPCHIIEIQYGEETTEDDIERLEYYDGE
jgi:cytidyltransferase-like protein